MIVRFHETATELERVAVERAAAKHVRVVGQRKNLVLLEAPLVDEEAIAIAAMPGVAEIRRGHAGLVTVGDTLIAWVAAGSLVLGLLILFAAQFPAELGTAVNPQQTPANLHPVWPLIPWFEAIERMPAWMPVTLLPLLVSLVMLGWPILGRNLATRRPALHTALGIFVLAVVFAAGWLGVMR